MVDCLDPDCPCPAGTKCNPNTYKCEEIKCPTTNQFRNRCPSESASINLACASGEVCIYRLTDVCVVDNSGKESNTISSGYYCIDKKSPYFISIEHFPELNSSIDETYDPYPNYYIDKDGKKINLKPEKLVIDKEVLNFTIKGRDEYNGYEISGISTLDAKFDLAQKPISAKFPTSPCPDGALYSPPAAHNASFKDLTSGFGTLTAIFRDQAGNSATNSNYQVYVFLGARGDQQGQKGTDKIVFLKTTWNSVDEVRDKTNNLAVRYGLNSYKKFDCFGYPKKCTFIKDVVGKTDEFSDCLWVGPKGNPRNVRIYDWLDGVYLDSNTKLQFCSRPDSTNCVIKKNDKVHVIWPNVNGEVAICAKNDTGILVDLPRLVSENIKDGFQILPSTIERFSVIWQVKYSREQRIVYTECYLNPTIDGINACTISEIIAGTCNLNTAQKCYCYEGFPCYQDTSIETIHSCSVYKPRYLNGINRIICRMYEKTPFGAQYEVWYNHDFYFLNGEVIKEKNILNKLLIRLLKFITQIFKL